MTGTILAPGQPGVTLESLLAAKEARARRQREWLTRWQQPLISLSLVTPGPVKDSLRYRNLMGVALQACDQLLWQRRWPVLAREVFWSATGPTALWCVQHPASALKSACMALEQAHLLGRLWDIDVLCPQAGMLGRRAFARQVRRCLLCSEPAHACARSRRHPLPEVVAKVERMIDDYLARD